MHKACRASPSPSTPVKTWALLAATALDIEPPAYTGLDAGTQPALSGKFAQDSRLRWTLRFAPQPQRDRSNNVPAALAGAVIGGILGHQVGGGSGRDIATVGGVVAGAAVGSRVGNNERSGDPQRSREVQRCAEVSNSAQIDHYEVNYTFRGQAHQIQTTTLPGATVTVNRQGEPRQP